MHQATTFSNMPDAAAVAAAAGRASKRHLSTLATAQRDAAIAAAVRGGASAAKVAREMGLSVQTVRRIETEQRGKTGPLGGTARNAGTRPASGFGAVLFDQASAMALAVRDAKPNTCRWPIGEGAAFRFCGATAVTGAKPEARTYCGTCAALAWPGRARTLDLAQKAA